MLLAWVISDLCGETRYINSWNVCLFSVVDWHQNGRFTPVRVLQDFLDPLCTAFSLLGAVILTNHVHLGVEINLTCTPRHRDSWAVLGKRWLAFWPQESLGGRQQADLVLDEPFVAKDDFIL